MFDYEFKEINTEDLQQDLLNKFNRYQTVKRSWVNVNGKWQLIENSFNYDWDIERKRRTVKELAEIKQSGGVIYGVFDNSDIIAFSSVGPDFSEDYMAGYIPIGFIHVSYEYRNKGIGKKLFAMMTEKAKHFEAKKIYICIMPAEESYAFYKNIGCTDAVVIHKPSAEYDYSRQMEFVL